MHGSAARVCGLCEEICSVGPYWVPALGVQVLHLWCAGPPVGPGGPLSWSGGTSMGLLLKARYILAEVLLTSSVLRAVVGPSLYIRSWSDCLGPLVHK